MSVKLSKTEIEVGKLYFEHGKKPKEIAELLGLSINTVYKAISKYRSYIRELEKDKKVDKDNLTNISVDSSSKTEENCKESKLVRDSLPDNGNGKVVSAVEEVKSKVCRRSTTVLSFKAYLPILPSSFILSDYREKRTFLYNVSRNDDDIVSKFVDCMLSIARELENIRDVLLKISERIENIKIVSENVVTQSATVNSRDVREVRDEQNNIPSFIRDNVWVDIIKSKYANID